jgi:hypothetical protein
MVVAPAIASAQGYYGPNYGGEPGFHHRMGHLVFGGSIGFGFMNDSGDRITCTNCSYTPISFEVDGHIGGMLTDRFAILFEAQANFQLVSLDNGNGAGDQTLVQSAAMVAAQYWVLPMFWIKGGVGLANLTVDHQYYNAAYSDPGTNGVAIMAAAGFELFSSRRYVIELQGRIISGSYDGISDHITAGNLGIGVNWF